MRRAAFLVLLLLAGCARRGDPVRGLLDDTAKAAEKRDASALVSHLTADFRADDGQDRAQVEQTVRGILAGYESLGVKLSEVTIERSPEAARVAFRADLSGAPRGAGLAAILPRSGAWRFDLRVVKERDEWKIASAGWRPLERGGP